MEHPGFRRGVFPAGIGAIAVLVLVAVAAGCGGSSNNGNPTTPANSTITIVPGAFNKGMAAFSPPSDTVHVNDVVRLHNGDSITHTIQTVTPNGPSWGNIAGNTNRDVTVTVAGTFTYKCTIASHTMSGQIVVLP